MFVWKYSKKNEIFQNACRDLRMSIGSMVTLTTAAVPTMEEGKPNYRYCCASPYVTKVKEVGTRSLLVFFLFVSVLYAGRKWEQSNVQGLPGTTHLYETEQVCGLDLPTEYSQFLNSMKFGVVSSSDDIKTVDEHTSCMLEHPPLAPLASITHKSAELARSQGNIVQHCGDCGQCSNPHDIAIYDETRNTLFRSSLQCSTRALLIGRQSATTCLDQAVGFTEGCRDCWVDNFMCTTSRCFFTCTWMSLFSKVRTTNGESPQQLNECLQCDEKKCGPAFLKCAGANRRRVGISSDIQRNHREECRAADGGWWRSESLQRYYQLTKNTSRAIERDDVE